MQFTHKEKTVKNQPAELATKQAAAVLKDKYNVHELCMNEFRGKEGALLTIQELSKLVEDLVDDTLFHAGWYHGTQNRH